MFSVLDRYIGKIIFNSIITTLFILISLSGIIKFVEQLRKIGQGNYSVWGAGLFTMLNVPKDVEIFFPMSALLGSLLGLGALATHSELVVMQASGFSQLQISCSMMKTAIPLMIFSMVIGELIAPISEKMARNYRAKAIYGGSMLSTKNGFWFKESNDFIFIERVLGSNELIGINIYHFDKNKRLKSLRYADKATFSNNRWRLSHVNESELTNDKQITEQQIVNMEWETNLTPNQLEIVALEPNSLSILGLYNYINYLKHSGQEFHRFQLSMWNKIFSPLLVAVMMLMSLSFIFGPLRNVLMRIRVITGISFGFLFYILDQIFGPFSLVYGIPPIFGALFPIIIFIIISIIMLILYI